MIRNSKGQSTVEFALVLPILILILVGIIEFGLIFKTTIQLNYGANEIARAVSLDATPADVTTISTSVFSDLEASSLQVLVSPAGVVKGQAITVQITYNYKLITPIMGSILGNTINLKGKSVIIKE